VAACVDDRAAGIVLNLAMRLNQVIVAVSDLDRAVAFYAGLGLRLIVRGSSEGGDTYARFLCPDGDSTFSVIVEAVRTGTTVVGFECDDLDDRVRSLQAAGYAVTDPEDQPWLWREAYLADPDGNPIMLFASGGNRLDPPWRLPD
jgi:catechol 2,3-dioxygenase-like lactoylglutathione lyase family enzyme